MPRKNFLIILSLFFCPICLLAQNVKEANKAFQSKEFRKAHHLYKQMVEGSEDDISMCYKFALASMHIRDYYSAEKYFIRVIEDRNGLMYPMSFFWLAHVKKNLVKYEEASELFKAFTMLGFDVYYTNWAAKEIETCRWAAYDLESEANIKIDLLKEEINSDFSEFGAIEKGNEVYFSTARSFYRENRKIPEYHLSKMMVSKNQERSQYIHNSFTEKGKHFCNTAFSNDWQRMYFTVCEQINAEVEVCEIHYSEQDNRGNWELESHVLPNHVNLPGFTTTHPAIGFDSATQREILFFVSDRPNGVGKMDIWYCEVDKNTFSNPINLTAINTPEDDVTPSFHDGTQTLFFSSQYYPGLGGFDIFSTTCENGVWGKVENLGKPINSSSDDLYFSINTNGNRAYLSSNRPGSRYHRTMYEGCCLDIYEVYFNSGQSSFSKN